MNLVPPQPSEVHGAVLPPDEHLACFDFLYYVCAHTVSYMALPPSRFSHLDGNSQTNMNKT